MKIVCPHCGSLEIAGAPGCGACLKPIPSGPWFAIEAYLRRQEIWSARTFGHGVRTAGLVKHIEKELAEILAKPHDLTEWIDVVILALDGFWRAGGQPNAIMDYLQAKQNVNFTRAWPPSVDGEPTEHDRTGELPPNHNYGMPLPLPTHGMAPAPAPARYCKRVPPIREKDRPAVPGEPCECLEGACMAFGTPCEWCRDGYIRTRSSVSEKFVHTDTPVGRVVCKCP